MKLQSIVDNFLLSYDSFFDSNLFGYDREKCINYIANSYIQFFRASEYRQFLIDFLKEYGQTFYIINTEITLKEDIENFIIDLIDYADIDLLDTYKPTHNMLLKLINSKDEDFYQQVINFYKEVGTVKLYSFTEIISQGHVNLRSINTLKKYIQELNIAVVEERRGKTGKYIKDSQLKKILRHIAEK